MTTHPTNTPAGQLSKNLGELKSADLDALEKLADAAPGKTWALTAGFLEIDGRSPLFQLFGSSCDCGDSGNPICGNPGEAEAAVAFMIGAQPTTIKALIAEVREARATIADVDRAARQAAAMIDAGYTVTVERTATHIYSMTNAFLSRQPPQEGGER